MLGDRPSGSATATDLQKRLRELKVESAFATGHQVASRDLGFHRLFFFLTFFFFETYDILEDPLSCFVAANLLHLFY